MSQNQQRRRNNAPINPPRPATVVPDFMFALAAAGWTMAGSFVAASFTDNNVTSTEAGSDLARLFAGALAMAATFTFLLGYGLLRGERSAGDHYVVPLFVGAAIGVAEALLFLAAAGELLLVPLVLFVFVLRPVRRLFARLVRPAREYSR